MAEINFMEQYIEKHGSSLISTAMNYASLEEINAIFTKSSHDDLDDIASLVFGDFIQADDSEEDSEDDCFSEEEKIANDMINARKRLEKIVADGWLKKVPRIGADSLLKLLEYAHIGNSFVLYEDAFSTISFSAVAILEDWNRLHPDEKPLYYSREWC